MREASERLLARGIACGRYKICDDTSDRRHRRLHPTGAMGGTACRTPQCRGILNNLGLTDKTIQRGHRQYSATMSCMSRHK